MEINKNLMQRNHTALKRGAGDIKYIVIHYVGALGGAWENTEYYRTSDVGASADFWVGFNGEVWQGNDYRNYYSWAIGGGLQGDGPHPYYKVATNRNSISIEMCVRKRNTATMNATDKDWYFEDATIESAAQLTAQLMKELNIDISHVIRHYDVNAKICPNPFVYNKGKVTWDGFKSKINGYYGAEDSGGGEPGTQKPDALYKVQTGAFHDKKRAEILESTLKRQGFETCIKADGGLYKVQVGAFRDKGNADAILKRIQSYGYGGFIARDSGGEKEKKVRVTADTLNIRTGPGTGYTTCGQIADQGVYTITETSGNWGKLKSGAGWICLDYTQNI